MTETEKTALYKDWSGKVRSYLQSRLSDASAAEDLCADVFVKVYEKLDTFDPSKASLSTWIFTIARNTLTDYFRTRKVHGEIPETLASDEDIEEELCRDEELERLAAALEKLDERGREIVVRRYYRGETLKTIGAELGISYAYVKLLHNRALAQLGGMLGQ